MMLLNTSVAVSDLLLLALYVAGILAFVFVPYGVSSESLELLKFRADDNEAAQAVVRAYKESGRTSYRNNKMIERLIDQILLAANEPSSGKPPVTRHGVPVSVEERFFFSIGVAPPRFDRAPGYGREAARQ